MITQELNAKMRELGPESQIVSMNTNLLDDGCFSSFLIVTGREGAKRRPARGLEDLTDEQHAAATKMILERREMEHGVKP